MKYMALKLCSILLLSIQRNNNFLPLHTHTHTPIQQPLFHFLLPDRSRVHLETAKCGHVLRLFAGDAPVVGLVDRLVVFPGRLVVHGEPLDGLCGESLTED